MLHRVWSPQGRSCSPASRSLILRDATPGNSSASAGAGKGSDPRSPTDSVILRGIGLLPSPLSHAKPIDDYAAALHSPGHPTARQERPSAANRVPVDKLITIGIGVVTIGLRIPWMMYLPWTGDSVLHLRRQRFATLPLTSDSQQTTSSAFRSLDCSAASCRTFTGPWSGFPCSELGSRRVCSPSWLVTPTIASRGGGSWASRDARHLLIRKRGRPSVHDARCRKDWPRVPRAGARACSLAWCPWRSHSTRLGFPG